MLSYLARALAGGVVGYVFGLTAGGGLIIWSIVSHIASPYTGASIVSFLFVLAFQSAIVGGAAGFTSARARGWDILWWTVPVGSLMGLLLVLLMVAFLGWRTGPNREYVVAAHSARNVASVNMVWGALVGLVVGLCLLPLYRPPQKAEGE